MVIWLENMRGVVSAVTGAGKTTFALLCIEAFKRKEPTGQIIILVPTIALADQWAVELISDLGVDASSIVSVGKANKGKKFEFVVSVVNSARNRLDALAKKRPTLLIVDECHRAGSEKNALALNGEFTATLGLSATPERQYDDGFLRFIKPVLGDVIYTYDYAQAYADRVIVPFNLVNVKFPLSKQEQHEYDALTRRVAVMLRSKTADKTIIEALLRKRARVSWNSRLRIPLAAKLALQHPGERIIIFHESVDSAIELREVLEARGIHTTIYHTRMSPGVRQENLLLFKNAFYSCLVCCRALDEGLNVPKASVAIIASSTASTRQRIQRLGRVLRHAKNKDSAVIYTLYGTPPEESRLKKEAVDMKEITSIKWLEVKE
ncbi:MAG: DEAD/DEAH box helicase [Glaciimonas sp.]|nr:DEAD/DEAH box helicase [Glaciimonas sp.]